jgi:amino acid adenylation domain-containing protein
MSDHWERQLASIGEPVRLHGVSAGVGEHTIESLLEPGAAGALERVTGGRDTERLVVLAACLAAVLLRLGDGDGVVVEVPRPASAPADWLPIAVSADLDRTLAATVRELDAAFGAAQDAPAPTAAQRAAYGAAVAELPVGVGHEPPPAGRFGLHVRLRPDAAALVLTYDAGRLDADAARGIATAVALTVAVLGGAQRPLRALELVPAEDRESLHAVGAGPRPSSPVPPFLERFDRNVERRRACPAVVFSGASITYGELDARSSRLAHRLRAEHAAGPDSVVAVALPKGIDAIVAIVATLKAGAAWLPLDVTQPAERRRAFLAAAKPVAVIDEPDGDDAGTGAPTGAAPAAAPSQLAYVIGTSGSTGGPKLVAVEHGAIDNYLAWKIEYHGMRDATVCLQLAPLSFDSAVSDVLATLACGGLLVLVADEQRLDPAELARLCARHGVTTFAAVPCHYRTFVGSLPADAGLELVTLAGERLTADVVAAHAQRLPGVRLVNEYGPSEGTIAATACAVDLAAEGDPPIGRPLDGTELTLVDRAGAIAPAGVPGEIALAGAGVARGYLGAAGDTGGFGADPAEPGRRLYRTGDLGRWRADGQLDYLGRIDGQVKIRGNRVELGEIEAALRAHVAVADAAVVLRDGVGGPDLVAYLVPSNGAPDAGGWASVSAALEDRLPQYMLPGRLVAVDALPLLPNGKLDRRALASRELSASASAAAGAPADELEGRLLELWRQLLEAPDMGVSDGFFEQGGHSLLAVQLVTEIADELGLELPLGELFDHSSVRAAAGWLRLHAGATA